jgi:hypothetical protein
MRNSSRKWSYLLLAFILLALAGCEKIDQVPNLAPKLVQVKNIVFYEFKASPYNARFYYNRYGNPDSVIYEKVSTWEPNMLFRYDSKQRLRECLEYYHSSTEYLYEEWHKYGYNNRNQAVIDTIYLMGQIKGNPETDPNTGRRISYLFYDAKGRIVKDSLFYRPPENIPPKVTIYEYDSYGNRVRPGMVYDNYLNIHQLHPIWQLLDRDYSVDNPFAAVSYNNYRLPLAFDQPYSYASSQNPFLFPSRALEKCEITYENK